MTSAVKDDLLSKISALCKRRGFVFPSSEIYGGLAGIYDYGPLGAELARNLRNLWWHDMVTVREDMYGLDGCILMHPRAWEASGHVAGFTDPLVDCPACRKRFRPDKLPGWVVKKDNTTGQWQILKVGEKNCPECGAELSTEVRQFNVLMETSLGAIEGEKVKAYLKGESCQNLYLDYQNVIDAFSPKLPFGLAQIGKAFRNEITLGKFIFRTREFEQMDVEYYVRPDGATAAYQQWKDLRWRWYVDRLGLKEKNLSWYRHTDEERIFYARDAWDILYQFPWGADELEGVHDRGDYDLKQHGKFSGKTLEYRDLEKKENFIPYIVECSGGLGRAFLAVLTDAYHEEDGRVFLSLDPKIAPYKAAIFPLVGNKPELAQKAREVFSLLAKKFAVAWDDASNIGKRYRRQDEAGTPYCLTVDYQTLKDQTLTVRNRDTMGQERLPIAELVEFLDQKVSF